RRRRTLSLRDHGAPVGNGGLPGTPHAVPRFGAPSHRTHSRSLAVPGSHLAPVLFTAPAAVLAPARATLAKCSHSRHATASGRKAAPLDWSREEHPRERAPSGADGRPLDPAVSLAGRDPRDPPRSSDGDRLHSHGAAAAVPDGAAPPGLPVVAPSRDRAPGAGALSPVPRARRPGERRDAARALPHPA